jgi:ATP-dependent Clp protease ATP-binding subunit ClpA
VVTKEDEDWLARTGYDPDYGARPLRRVLQRNIEDPLALALLEGRYLDGSVVTVDVEDDKIVLH